MIILASTSKYRKAQLESLGLDFICVSPGVDEDAVKVSGLSMQEKAEMLALQKAKAVQTKYPDAIIIAGDQIATIDNIVLSKPGNFEKNVEQLLQLSGREHHLLTSNVILQGESVKVHTEVARLKMKPLTEAQVSAYVRFADPLDCAGGYKIEFGGMALFESILVDDFSSIQGVNLHFIGRELAEYCWQK